MTLQITKKAIEQQRQQLLAELRFQVAQESDHTADSARQLAGRLAQISREKLDLAQVRSLETLAYSTDKVSDLTDLLKKRIGRDGRGERWAYEGVGQSLLSTLEGLRERANQVADRLKKYKLELPHGQKLTPEHADAWRVYDQDFNDLPRHIHLLLCREYVRHLAANFEYLRLEKEVSR